MKKLARTHQVDDLECGPSEGSTACLLFFAPQMRSDEGTKELERASAALAIENLKNY